MELWIKSQNNAEVGIVPRLKKVDDIYLDYCGENDSYYILVNDGIEVGYYNSEKRALEVLDEIQNKLKPTFITHEPKKYGEHREIIDTTPPIKVYEMPEE